MRNEIQPKLCFYCNLPISPNDSTVLGSSGIPSHIHCYEEEYAEDCSEEEDFSGAEDLVVEEEEQEC